MNTGGLPFLPGMSVRRTASQRNHKSQALVYHEGKKEIMNEKPGIGGTLLPGQQPVAVDKGSAVYYPDSTNPEDYTPSWVAFDRQVLRFYGYFKESVEESRAENYRVRRVIIYFYLADDSIHIGEPHEGNSGLPQGVLLKRHRVPKGPGAGFFTVGDFAIGHEVTIYNRVYRVVDCDDFSRAFMEKLGMDVGDAPEEVESGPYDAFRATMEAKRTHTKVTGKHDQLRQFLAHDREVLRFFCSWKDPEHFGRRFALHFYLSDDTLELKELLQPNSGRDPCAGFMKRQKLPRSGLSVGSGGMAALGTTADAGSMDYYSEEDLRIGTLITVYNRPFLLYDCDSYTKDFYKSQFGLTEEDFAPLALDYETEVAGGKAGGDGQKEPEETLLASTFRGLSVDPNERRVHDTRHILRFRAAMDTTSSVNSARRFVVSYFLHDSTLSVFESEVRNSGIPGGKFLEKSRVPKSDGSAITPADLFVGARVAVHGHAFKILDADEWTLKFYEAREREYPVANMDHAIRALRAFREKYADSVDAVFHQLDSDGDGQVSAKEMREALLSLQGFPLTPHELITIMRRYDSNGDGRFSIHELAELL